MICPGFPVGRLGWGRDGDVDPSPPPSLRGTPFPRGDQSDLRGKTGLWVGLVSPAWGSLRAWGGLFGGKTGRSILGY